VTPEAAAMITFLKERVLRDGSMAIDEDTSLVASGLVDSLSLVEVLMELSRVTGRRIPASRVSPEHFETVAEMLAMAERLRATAR
jgi:acyl carrier protein